MKYRFAFLFVALNLINVIDSLAQDTNELDTLKMKGEKHLMNIRMLTSAGENAEAYLSFSNQKLIYQSTVGDIKCDQIFIMNIDGSDNKIVSTGFGRTTCSYFLPGDSTILYA